jgi:hypothetical protein
MIWLFERPHERPLKTLSVETGYDNVSGEYLVTQRRPDGECIVERFPDSETLESRLVALEHDLEGDRWQRRSADKPKRSRHP